MKHLRSSAEEGFSKRIPVLNAQERHLPDQFLLLLDQLKALHSQLGEVPPEERFVVEHQIAEVRRVLGQLEKKLSPDKKVA
jgi:hypothetical protein